jgi:integrase
MDKYTTKWLEYYPPRHHKRRLAALERFRKFVKEEPRVLLQKAKRSDRGCQKLEDALEKYYRHLKEEGRAPSTAAQWYAVVRSYFTRNRVSLCRFPREISTQSTYETTDVLSQDEVKKMVQSRTSIRDKAVIAFLAQTGQRIGVLTAMKINMIKTRGSHGLVEVPGGTFFQNPKGHNVNKYQVHYKFVIGEDTMQLIDKLPKSEGGWLFDISQRQIGRIVDEAASAIGTQEPIQTEVNERSMHRVHPHVFRKYWKRQMKLGGIKDRDLLDFVMAHKLPYRGTYDAFPDEDILKAYEMAEPMLKVLPETDLHT